MKIKFFEGTNSITIINNEYFTLREVEIKLNDEYEHKSRSISPGDTLEILKTNFTKDIGEPLPAFYKLKKISIFSTSPEGDILQFYWDE